MLTESPIDNLHHSWFSRCLSERVINVSRTRLGDIDCVIWVPMQIPDTIPTFVKITARTSLLESMIDPPTTNFYDAFGVVVNCRTDSPAKAIPEIQQYCGEFKYPDCLLLGKTNESEIAFSIAMRVREAIEIFEQRLGTDDAFDQMAGSTGISDVLLSIKDPEAFDQKVRNRETERASEDLSAGNYQIIAGILEISTENYSKPE